MMFRLYELTRRQTAMFVAAAVVLMIAVAAAVYSCRFNHTYPKELTAIDSLCESRPDSAMALLEGMPKQVMEGDAEFKWYYRFLLQKSCVKMNVFIKDDSEIKEIVGHYEGGSNKNILAQVYYVAGCVYNSLKDTPQAISYFHKSIDVLQETDNEKYKGLCYYQLGHLYSVQELHKKALAWQRKSLAIHKKYNDNKRCIYDYVDMAWTMGCLGNIKMSVSYLGKALHLANVLNDKYDISEIESQIAVHYLSMDSMQIAKKYIDNAMSRDEGRCSSEINSIALKIYDRLGLDCKAKEFCEYIIRHGNVYGKKYAYLWLTKNSIMGKNLDVARNSIDCYIEISDSVQKTLSADAAAKADALYNYSIRERENMQLEKENVRKNIYIVVLVSSLIIIALVLLVVYFDIKRKRQVIEARCRTLGVLLKKEQETNEEAIEKKKEEINRIKKQLSELKEKDELNRISLEKLLNSQRHELQNINFDVKQRNLSDLSFKKTDVYMELLEISKNHDHQKFSRWSELEQAVYESYPSFERRICDFEKMSDIELKVCLLLRSGFNAKSIGEFLFKTQTSVYSICKRLYFKNFGEKAASSRWENLIKSIY